MRKKELRQIVLGVSEGLFATTIDLILYWLFLSNELVSHSNNSRGVYLAFSEANQSLGKINYQTFKMAFLRLKKQGLLQKEAKITAMGRKRLSEIIPSYQKERTWDKKIYLVTYDIPTSRNHDRDLLRKYLKRISCALLQESVWLTPYNPQKILRDFSQEKNLKGTILVSNLGLDGQIGEEDLQTLIRKIYKLEEINNDYEEFLEKYSGVGKSPATQLGFDFYTILNRDPQLPFELLPKNWLGQKAYRLFLSKTSKKV